MRWITNAHKSEIDTIMVELTCGHEGKRQLVEGTPKESGANPVGRMVFEGIVGIYEVSPCPCAFCTEQRRNAPLRAWKQMNKHGRQTNEMADEQASK